MEARSGNPLEIAMLLFELSHSQDPYIQFFLVFFAFTIGIPFFGGLIILFLDYTKQDGNVPRKAFSYIPFMGVLLELYWTPLAFLKRQVVAGVNGYIFSLDTIVRETTCLFGIEGLRKWSNLNGGKNNWGQMLFLGDQMGSLFDPMYKSNLSLYNSIAQQVFNDPKFNENLRPRLKIYLASKITSLQSSKKKVKVDLFALTSSLYLHSLLYTVFGEKFVLEHGDELVDELHQTQLNMNFTLVRFVNSFGIPTGPSQHTDKVAKKIKALVSPLLAAAASDSPPQDYITILSSRLAEEKARGFAWSHCIHLILSSHASFVSLASWTFYHKSTSSTPLLPFSFYLAETSRRYGPVMLSKTLAETCDVNGYIMQTGSTLFVSPASIHLDPTVYADAYTYRASRWTSAEQIEKAVLEARLCQIASSSYGFPHGEFVRGMVGDVVGVLDAAGVSVVEPGKRVLPERWAVLNATWAKGKVLVRLPQIGEDEDVEVDVSKEKEE